MAAILQRPALPREANEGPVTPNGGKNTLISHEGKWHNLRANLGERLIGEEILKSNGGVEFQRGGTLSANGLDDEKGKKTEEEEAKERGAFSTDAIREKDFQNITSSGRFEDLNDDVATVNGACYGDFAPWDGYGAQADEDDPGMPLSPAKILELASSRLSLPMSELSPGIDGGPFPAHGQLPVARGRAATSIPSRGLTNGDSKVLRDKEKSSTAVNSPASVLVDSPYMPTQSFSNEPGYPHRPPSNARAMSTPLLRRRLSASKGNGSTKDTTVSSNKQRKPTPTPLRFKDAKTGSRCSALEGPEPSPMPKSIPMPPLSLPTYLQLELSSHHPSPLYIHRSVTSDFPYESSRIKLERLLNFIFLPPQLEQVLWFGTLACLDAWLYSFTILPLRFLKALSILGTSWGHNIIAEAQFIGSFIYTGLGRMWRRKQRSSNMKASERVSLQDHESDEDRDKAFVPGTDPSVVYDVRPEPKVGRRHSTVRRHRRNKSTPSALLPDHKADILKGFLTILTCVIMMYFDPSRMYHAIRGQADIKLYVIYNVLEVCDRLFAALGQDVLECLFSKETLERKSDGRSKILRPFWLFLLALAYNLIHATSLFYQVITLNVAVNSYSNALLTLLMSNQFVEIKSTVFKKFEKDNLFQITCADVVERFQLWLMLTIIASRNIVETGSLMPTSSSSDSSDSSALLPKAFTIELIPFLSGKVVGPYLIVLGSEMLVDWLKHAYITKFNMTKPAIYGRFLDVLCKDYYSNAFATQNLTRRLGLPVLPLACLFIRASMQTYHMFLATYMPSPLPPPPSSAPTSIALPAPTAIFPSTISSFLSNFLPDTPTHVPFTAITPDALLTLLTIALAFLLIYLTLLALKLLLGMALLHFARTRYRGMKEREEHSFHAEGRRVGGWGMVEVDEDKKRWIYADDLDGFRKLRDRENRGRKEAAAEGGGDLATVDRYSMVAKRIW